MSVNDDKNNSLSERTLEAAREKSEKLSWKNIMEGSGEYAGAQFKKVNSEKR